MARISISKNKKDSYVELFVYAFSNGDEVSRPVLIFRDLSEKWNLPVWLEYSEMGVRALEITSRYHSKSEHSLTASQTILQSAGIEITACYFDGVQGHHQYVLLKLKGHPKLKEIRMRADEAIPLCLAMKAQFFATPEFIMQCRDLDAQMLGLQQSLQIDKEIAAKKHSYMM